MAILFESFEAVHQGDSVVSQPPQAKNLLSISTTDTAPTAERKAKRDEWLASVKDNHAGIIAQEEARSGLEVAYYTNTETREYRVLSYSPSIRDRALSGEVFPKGLRGDLAKKIPGYTAPKVRGRGGGALDDSKKNRKRSHSAGDTEGVEATEAARASTPNGYPAVAEHRPGGRPPKRLRIEATSTKATSSAPTTTELNPTPPESVSSERIVVYQRRPNASVDTGTDTDPNHFPSLPSWHCEESCPHPVTGQEQLILAHGGKVLPCGNSPKHDPQKKGERKPVCQQCVLAGHQLIQTHCPYLLTSALLPLCIGCTQEAKTKYPSVNGYNGCICPLQLPPETSSRNNTQQNSWNFCLRCRVQWLEHTNIRLVAEEEFRRGIVGVGIVNGKKETVFLGRVCICGQHLGGMPFSDDGFEGCAKRCAGCGGIWHAGTPARSEVQAS